MYLIIINCRSSFIFTTYKVFLPLNTILEYRAIYILILRHKQLKTIKNENNNRQQRKSIFINWRL